jgi:hypothetical protein
MASLTPPLSLVLSAAALAGLLAGLAATVAMDLPMYLLPEGRTPPSVAAGVLTDEHPDDASGRLATVVHYGAGAGTGVLYAVLATLVGTLLGFGSLAALVAGAVALYPLMVGFFVVVVLPRSKGLPMQRIRRIRRDWALSAAAYLAALVALFYVVGGLF